MEQSKRLCQIDLEVTRLKVEIRFPCEITYSVRLDQQEIVSDESVRLNNYCASFSKRVTISGEIDYDGVYLSKLGVLNVYVVSGKRRNIIGTLEFDVADILNGKGTAELEAQLIRCLDKNSFIKLRIAARPLASSLIKSQSYNARSLVDSRDSSLNNSRVIQDNILHQRQRSITTNDNTLGNQRLNKSFVSSFRSNDGQNRWNSSRERKNERQESEKKFSIRQIESLKNEINYLRASNQLKESRRVDVPNSTKSLETEIKVLRTSKDELERSFKDSKRSLQQTFTKNGYLETEIESLKNKLQLKQSYYLEEIKRGNQRANEFERVNSEITRQLLFLKQDQTSQEIKWSLWEQERSRIGAEMETLKTQNIQFLDEIKQLEGYLAIRDQDIIDKVNQLDERLHEINYLKTLLNTKDAFTTEQAQTLRRQNNDLRGFNEEFQRVINNKDRQIRVMSQQLEILGGKIDEFGRTNEHLQSLLASASNRPQSLNTSHDPIHMPLTQSSQLNNLHQQIDQLSQMNNELQQWFNNQISLLRQNNHSLAQQINYYKSVVTGQQQDKYSLNPDLQSLCKQNNEMNEELDAFAERCRELEIVISEKYQRIQELQKQIENLEFSIENYKTLFKRDNQKLEETLTSLNQLRSENISMSASLQHFRSLQSAGYNKQVSIKLLETNNLALQLSKQQLTITINQLEQQNLTLLNQLSDTRTNKEALRQTNNNLGERIQEQENNFQQIRFKYKNLEFQNQQLRKRVSSNGGVEEDYRNYKQSVQRVVNRYRTNILIDENQRLEETAISELLWECKEITTNFVIQLRQQYQLTISQLQCQLNHIKQHTPSYNNISVQLNQVQSDQSYYQEVVSVKEQLLLKEIDLLKAENYRLNEVVTRSADNDTLCSERLNDQQRKIQQLVLRIEEMGRYIIGIQEERSNLHYQLERSQNVLRERNTDVGVITGEVQGYLHRIQELVDQLNWERNKRVEMIEEVNGLKRQLDQKITSQKEYYRKIQQYQNRNVLQQATNRQNSIKQERTSGQQIQKLKVQNKSLTEQINNLKQIKNKLEIQLAQKRENYTPAVITPIPIQAQHHCSGNNFLINDYNQSQLIPEPQYKHSHNNEFFHHNTHPVPTTVLQQQYFDCQSRYESRITELLQDKLSLQESIQLLKSYIVSHGKDKSNLETQNQQLKIGIQISTT